MIKGKGEYLRELTSRMRMKSINMGKELEGSTPPSVFIGSWNYPKVLAGPMVTPVHGDTSLMDTPEDWIPGSIQQEEIIDFRLNLVRGKQAVKVKNVDSRLCMKLKEISLAKSSVEGEVEFKYDPRGYSFDGRHAPHGPAAEIKEFSVSEGKWNKHLEKKHYDIDLKAADAVEELHSKKVEFSRIQKAFSTGSFGLKRGRRLVPTRWSITACDTILANRLLAKVRHHDLLDCYQVYEFNSLNNHYAIILLPTAWQFEWMEGFLKVMGNEELLFSDFEHNKGKKGYSSVGGCYYSCKFAVLEALDRMKKQAGAIILREAYSGYVPMGVFNVRENVRNALKEKPRKFNSLGDALQHASYKLRLPKARFIRQSTVLKENLYNMQTTLQSFIK